MLEPAEEKKLRGEIRNILQHCQEGSGANMGLVLIKKSDDQLFLPITSGFPSSKALLSFFSVEEKDDLWDVLYKRKPGRFSLKGHSILVAPFKSGQKYAGLVALLSSRRSFSPKDTKIVLIGATAIGHCVKLKRALASIQKNYLNTIMTLLKTIESKDKYSQGHSDRVADYCQRSGSAMGFDQKTMDNLFWAALLHDVGKIGIVDSILQKKSSLTDEEMAIVQMHPVIGQQIVQDLGFLKEASLIIRHHHERYDGRGYPDGLPDKKIPMAARILSLAEAFDTITSDTPYRKGKPLEEAAIILREMKGSQFDPELVDVFLESIIF